jgi:hypothetical protein
MGAKQKIKLAKSFADAVEEGVFALNKKGPTIRLAKSEKPTIRLKKEGSTLDIGKSKEEEDSGEPPDIGAGGGAPPDIGEETTKDPSRLEKAQQFAEDTEGHMSDVAFGASVLNTGKDILKLTPKVAKFFGSTAGGLGKAAGHLQTATWAADALQSVLNKEYRDKEVENQAARLEDGDMLGAMGASIQRPTSGLYGIATAKMDAVNREREAEGLLAIALAESRRKPKPQDVPPLRIRDQAEQRDQKAARKFFK